MTSTSQLHELAAITQALYEQQQTSFQRIVAEENRLRNELLRLDEMLLAARAEDTAISDMRAIGADIIWQGWVGRSKTELNLKLSRVLAIKEHHLKQVQQAFGKMQVVRDLTAQQLAEARKKLAQNQLSLAVDQALFKRP